VKRASYHTPRGKADETLQCLRKTFSTIPSNAKVEQLLRSGVSDAAALATMRLQLLEAEACLMHGGQKIAESGIGRLVQSEGKQQLDPFPEGVSFQKAVHKFSTHFSYGTERLGNLHGFCELMKVPKLKPAPDNCETRVAGLHREVTPIVRMGPACVHYSNNEKLVVGSGGLDDSIVQEASEVESVLRQVTSQTTLAQCESAWTGAYRQVLPASCLSSLESPFGLDVISTDKSGAGRPVREKRKAQDFSQVEKTTHKRAIKRAKLQQEKVGFVTTKRDQIAMMLDPRVMRSSAFTAAMRKEARETLEEEYVNYYLNAHPPKVSSTPAGDAGAEPEPEAPASVAALTFDYALSSDDIDSSDDESNAEFAKLAARKAFNSGMKHWKKAVHEIDWATEFPGYDWAAHEQAAAGLSAPEQLVMLLELDMAPLFIKFLNNIKLGYLPHIALTVLGNNLASSHVERMNSAVQLILHKSRTLLNDELLNMLQ
jgi:hypothetical protein